MAEEQKGGIILLDPDKLAEIGRWSDRNALDILCNVY